MVQIFSILTNFLIICSINSYRSVLKICTMIAFVSFPYRSVKFCFVGFKTLLLGTHKLRIMSSLYIITFIMSNCLCPCNVSILRLFLKSLNCLELLDILILLPRNTRALKCFYIDCHHCPSFILVPPCLYASSVISYCFTLLTVVNIVSLFIVHLYITSFSQFNFLLPKWLLLCDKFSQFMFIIFFAHLSSWIYSCLSPKGLVVGWWIIYIP